ncbi:sigma 54-interacting transcriptional regulator [bacterium]|nr:sigma 54-interacting transcriptional regulator [bacterium]
MQEFIANRYKILSLLGKGGNGEIYKVSDTFSGSELALKILKTAEQNLENEFSILKKLSHPFVCKVYDFGFWKTDTFFTMEILFQKELDFTENISEGIEIALSIAQGLHYVHSNGIVHYDLKPENILFSNKNEPKILDFGFSSTKQIQEKKGSIFYIAPEILKQEKVGKPADFYSFGCLLFKFFTGKTVFEGTSSEVLQSQITQNPKNPQTLNPKISNELSKLILQLLEKEPKNRVQTTSDLVYRLAKLLLQKTTFTFGESKIIGRETEINFLVLKLLKLDSIEQINVFGEEGSGKTKLFEEVKLQVQTQIKLVTFENFTMNSLSKLAGIEAFSDKEINVFFKIKTFLESLASKIIFLFKDFAEELEALFNFLKKANSNLKILVWYETKAPLKQVEGRLELTNFSFELHEKQIFQSLYSSSEKVKKLSDFLFHLTVGNPHKNQLLLNFLWKNRILKITEIGLDFEEKELKSFNFSKLLEQSNLLFWESLLEQEKEAIKLVCTWNLPFTLEKINLLAQLLNQNQLSKTLLEALESKRVVSFASNFYRLQNKSLAEFLKNENLLFECSKELLSSFAKINFSENPEFEAFYSNDVEISLRAARKMVQEKNFEEAERFYKQVLSSKDDTFVASVKIEFANFLLDSGKNAEVIELLKDFPICYENGLAFQREGNYQKAQEIFSELAKNEPSLKVLANLIQIKIYLGNFREAEELCSQILQKESLKEEFVTIYSLAGEISFYQRDFEKAEQFFLKSLELAQKTNDRLKEALVSNSLGSLNDLIGNFEEAEKFYKNAEKFLLEIGDLAHLPLVFNNFGELYRKAGKWDLSEKFHLKSLELKKQMDNPREMAFSLNNLGVLFYFKNDLQTSSDFFEKALAIQEKLQNKVEIASLLSNVGEVSFAIGNYSKAKIFFERAIPIKTELKVFVEVGEVYFFLGEIELKQENFEKSKDYFFHSLEFYNKAEIRSKHSKIYLRLSEIYSQKNVFSEVENFIEKAINIAQKQLQEQETVNGFLAKAKFFLLQNKVEQARKLLEEKILFYEKKISLKVQFLALLYFVEKEKGSILVAQSIKRECVKIDRKYLQLLNKNDKNYTQKPKNEVKMNLSSDRLKALFEISQKINSILDLEKLLTEILNLLVVTLGAEQGLVILISEKGKLEIKASWQLTEIEREFSSTVVKEVIENAKTVFCPNVKDDIRFNRVESISNFQSLSLICTPLYSKNDEKIIGALYVDSRNFDHIFVEEDIEFLNAFANLSVIAIENSKQHKTLLSENESLKKQVTANYKFSKIIGKSQKMIEIFSLMDSVISTPVTVLIEGESGTGKELVAKAIHYNDPLRSKFNFVAVNCGALPETILETELFGHVKGSFTGAVKDKEGLFETANNGTIFLDEIGETSQNMQVKLLRVIQEREITKVGDSKPIKIDVRIICATNKKLEEEVEKGNFREDLFYRINVIRLEMPNLSERIDDIPLLAEYFLKMYKAKMNKKQIEKISDDVIDTLMVHKWKGNIRELENVIERAVVLCNEPEITVKHLPEKIRQLNNPKKSFIINDKEGDFRDIVKKVERDLIIHYLKQAKGSIELASQLSGLPKRTFQRKKKDCNVSTDAIIDTN